MTFCVFHLVWFRTFCHFASTLFNWNVGALYLLATLTLHLHLLLTGGHFLTAGTRMHQNVALGRVPANRISFSMSPTQQEENIDFKWFQPEYVAGLEVCVTYLHRRWCSTGSQTWCQLHWHERRAVVFFQIGGVPDYLTIVFWSAC